MRQELRERAEEVKKGEVHLLLLKAPQPGKPVLAGGCKLGGTNLQGAAREMGACSKEDPV